MHKACRLFEWDSAHRVLQHESKCKYLHGHRYKAEVVVQAVELDSLGRVIDFGCLKGLLGAWIDKFWDHNTLLNSADPLLLHVNHIQKPFVFVDLNPTAEVIAEKLYHVATELLPSYLHVESVKVWETPNCYALYQK